MTAMPELNQLVESYLEGNENAKQGLLRSSNDLLIAVITEHLQGADKRKTWRLLHLLKDCEDERVVDRVIPYLRHPASAIQAMAAQIIGQWRTQRGLDALLEQLTPPEQSSHIWIVQAIGMMQNCEAVIALCKFLPHAQSEILLYTIIKIIGELGDKSLISTIEMYLQHPSHHVRTYTRSAIEKLKTKHIKDK